MDNNNDTPTMDTFVSGVTVKNVEQRFKDNINKWRDNAFRTGKAFLSELEQAQWEQANEVGDKTIDTSILNYTTKTGHPLTVERYINETLPVYEYKYQKYNGSVINRDLSISFKIYLDYLNAKQQQELYTKIQSPTSSTENLITTINIETYNPNLIYEKFNKVLFECNIEVFNSWFVNGEPHSLTVKIYNPTHRGQVRELWFLLQCIVIDKENAKQAYFNTVFRYNIKSNQYKSKTFLSKENEIKLEECRR